MNSYKNLFLIKGMTLWNCLTSWLNKISESSSSFYGTIYHWFQSDSGTWYLFSDVSFPVRYEDHYGLRTMEWKYHPKRVELTYMGEPHSEQRIYRIGWLSARTIVEGSSDSKDMDAFLSSLRIKTVSGNPPPLMVLLQAWSLYDKKWWSRMESVRLEWYDEMAEEGSATHNETPCIPLVLMDSHLLKRKN